MCFFRHDFFTVTNSKTCFQKGIDKLSKTLKEVVMLIFRSIVCLFFLTCGYAQEIEPKVYPRQAYSPSADVSNNFVIRAQGGKDKVRIDHVDQVSFVIDSELQPFLKVEGRVCLNIEGDAWCDMTQKMFQLALDDFYFEIRTTDKQDVVEVFLRQNSKLVSIGESILLNSDFQTIELSKDIILFFDKVKAVPALMWLKQSHSSYLLNSRRKLFDRLYKNII